jgi:hypothetical protein
MGVLKEIFFVLALSLLLPLAKLLIVLVSIAEMVAWVWVCSWAIEQYGHHGRAASILWWPVLATAAIYFQMTLWHYLWLKMARASDRGRVLGEYFCSSLRYPIRRPPHSWE